MRNMSFSMTTQQIRDRTKTVTRRMGWRFLKRGDKVCAIVKGQGLKKGEKVERLCIIEVVDVRREPLNAITPDDVVREGFHVPSGTPGLAMTTDEFIDMFRRANCFCPIDEMITRIEFKYLEEKP